jgi:cell division protein FtsI (penicillin-binding protein 3)
VKTLANDKQIEVQAITVSNRTVPNLTGMGAKDAVYILENMGLNVQVSGRGKVYSQNMKPGTIARKGTSVMINLQ